MKMHVRIPHGLLKQTSKNTLNVLERRLIQNSKIAYTIIKVTFNWVRNKIREKLAKKNVKKVYMAAVQKLVEECDNEKILDKLNNYDFVMANVNNQNQVEDVDLIKNTDDKLDEEVDRLLSSKREVVITG